MSPAEQVPLPTVILAAGAEAGLRFLEFHTANIPNDNTRAACFSHLMRYLGKMH